MARGNAQVVADILNTLSQGAFGGAQIQQQHKARTAEEKYRDYLLQMGRDEGVLPGAPEPTTNRRMDRLEEQMGDVSFTSPEFDALKGKREEIYGRRQERQDPLRRMNSAQISQLLGMLTPEDVQRAGGDPYAALRMMLSTLNAVKNPVTGALYEGAEPIGNKMIGNIGSYWGVR